MDRGVRVTKDGSVSIVSRRRTHAKITNVKMVENVSWSMINLFVNVPRPISTTEIVVNTVMPKSSPYKSFRNPCPLFRSSFSVRSLCSFWEWTVWSTFSASMWRNENWKQSKPKEWRRSRNIDQWFRSSSTFIVRPFQPSTLHDSIALYDFALVNKTKKNVTNKYRFPIMRPFVWSDVMLCRMKSETDGRLAAEGRRSSNRLLTCLCWCRDAIESIHRAQIRFHLRHGLSGNDCRRVLVAKYCFQMISISLEIVLNFVQHWFSLRISTVDHCCRSVWLFDY